MMKKKISILTLIFLFLVSTTGLPVFYHYCEMMGKKSLTECQSCQEEEIEETFSCCSIEESDFEIQLKAEKTSCCIDEFDYKKIEDDFFQTITSNPIPITSVVTEFHLSSCNSQNEIKFLDQTNYDLPPPKFGKELLNTIHQLKFDLPVC